MDIDEYRIDFLENLRNEADLDGNDVDDQFLQSSLALLEDMGWLMDPYPFPCNMRGSKNHALAFDAYAYDDADNSIVLLISEFHNTREKVTLTKTRIDELYNKMRYFIEEAYTGDIRKYCDESDPIIGIAKEFKKKIGVGKINTEVIKFKFYIVTNAILSVQVKSIKEEELIDRPVEIVLWDLQRFYNAQLSSANEVINISCEKYGVEGIQCLKANLSTENQYDSYMAIVPGKFLAEIYLDYGSRLLEGNVRSFLSINKKVNKKIRETITGANPENFFTYNNGIAVVARSITLSADKKRIVAFNDFQIINGGQTTASLASAVIRKEVTSENLQKIFVPMKLTVLNITDDMTQEQEDTYNKVTQAISKSANSQTAVADADFFSNDPFHVIMEKISLKHMAPPVNGSPYQTIWYYERSKGKWAQEMMKMKDAERDKYKARSPKDHVITKEKLAKCLNCVYVKPHMVCAGNAYNIKEFAVTITDMYEKSKESINEIFFEKAVAAVILFDTVDKMVNNAEWYTKGGNKAQIVPYTISKIVASLPQGKDIDWKLIWKKQMLYSELVHQIEIISQQANDFFNEENGGVIVREFAKKQQTWIRYKENYPCSFTREFLNSLVGEHEFQEEQKSVAKQHKFNSEIELEVEVYKRGYDYWLQFYNDLETEKLLSSADRDFIKGIAAYIKRGALPSKLQVRRLHKIINAAEDAGYIMQQ